MDLSTTYMGLQLKNPIVPSSSPLSREIDTVKRMEDAGASAIVLWSLFEEQLQFESQELSHFLDYGTESFGEALSYFPEAEDYNVGPDGYLEHIQKLKQTVDIPIIGSLNGVSTGGWIDYAKKLEEAGCDAMELNVYYIPTKTDLNGASVEDIYLDVLKAVKSAVKIPVAMKLSPYFTSMANMANQLSDAGADALVMFNRFYQPDIDIDTLEVKPNLLLSTPQEMRLPLRWIALLYGRVAIDMAATTGIHTAQDVIKSMMSGAKVAMMCSALLRYGVDHIGKVLDETKLWMEEHEYDSIKLMQGSMSQKACPEPAAFERANYMKTLQSYV
ncbi:MAG: dihydroorotate dehydrogenase-like protein [Candidatus Hinthialibacter antarcticus]|nr:dihydroorotate dehydrogenase-like protein [Candidatus Hinthialibacter antarcticus]